MSYQDSPLGQPTVYKETYSPDLLFPIARTLARDKIGLTASLPFTGLDYWTGYELSWLNKNGKPIIACADFTFPCTTPNVIESKSFKLYLNSFNQSQFDSFDEVSRIITKDLSDASKGKISVRLYPLSHLKNTPLTEFSGHCLDNQDLSIDEYRVNPNHLKTTPKQVEESLYSDLLKSNCLATGQPDWGSLFIKYKGPQIDHEGLLKYIISFRNHSGFAEHCVEQIFQDLTTKCHPKNLTVYARYTRRGGLDINPFRSNFESAVVNSRQLRQ